MRFLFQVFNVDKNKWFLSIKSAYKNAYMNHVTVKTGVIVFISSREKNVILKYIRIEIRYFKL